MKTATPKAESGENNAFSLGKHCFYREKTSDLSRENLHDAGENIHFTPLKPTFSNQKKSLAPCSSFSFASKKNLMCHQIVPI